MAATAIIPDVAYLPQREATLAYEDARFRTLLSGVPNYYPNQTDYTLYGSILRALAQELARQEYDNSYDIVSYDPQYLTPPDIKRRFAGPLFINSSFPNSAQSDQDYKAMLVALLAAYPGGATVEVLEQVITAYTGMTVPVIELYTLIGDGIYDETDRNALKINLPVQGANPASEVTSATQLATLAEDLYGAIDLAKPAHIGLNYSITFGNGEDFSTLIASITDALEIIYYGVEESMLPPLLTLEPYFNPDSPDTRLSSTANLTGATPVGQTLPLVATDAEYAAMSAEFQAEYEPYGYGGYTLIPGCMNDQVVVDGSGTPTGQIVKPQGVLSPQLNRCWEIKSDVLSIFRLS